MLRLSPRARLGCTIVAVLAAASLIGPLLAGFDPYQQDLSISRLPPSLAHLLGTDQLGRDELGRLLYGARYSLLIGAGAMALGLAVGAPIGLASGYARGAVAAVTGRVTDMLQSFPAILLALLLVSRLDGGVASLIIAVGVASVPAFVRIARASALRLRQEAFVEAAMAVGGRPRDVLRRHVLPHAAGPLAVQATVQMAVAVVATSGLGFLGLGLRSPTPEWGAMLGEARVDVFSDPALAIYPVLAILSLVLAVNLIGDGIRDALDPRPGNWFRRGGI